jgi:transcriptional regulator with XRE-family HTH domain
MKMSTIGSRIKELRKKEGLTQVVLAGKLGLHYQAVQHWEKNRNAPRGDQWAKLATVLKTSKQYLLFGSDQMPAGEMDPRRHSIIEMAKIVPESALDWLEIQAELALTSKVFKKGGKARKQS